MKRHLMRIVTSSILSSILIVTLISCTQSSSSDHPNTAALLRINEELFKNGNLNAADNAFSPNYTFPGMTQKGPELIKSYISALRKSFPDLEYKIDNVIADGNRIAWTRTHTGTHTSDFMGYKASGRKISWKDMTVTEFGDDGKITQEWGTSDFDSNMQRAAGIDGVYEYLTPLSGKAIMRNGSFVFLLGPAAPGSVLVGQAGTYMIDHETITNTFQYSTNPHEVGTSFSWKVKSWAGDTITFDVLDNKGAVASEGRAVRTSF